MVTSDNLPKAYIYDAKKPMKGVVYPEVELEVPDFIALADELLEQEIEAKLEAERERIRILNCTPVNVLNPRLIQKKERAAKRKLKKLLQEQEDGNLLPAWIVNPGEADDGADEAELEAKRAADEKRAEDEAMALQVKESEQKARELELAKKKTN